MTLLTSDVLQGTRPAHPEDLLAPADAWLGYFLTNPPARGGSPPGESGLALAGRPPARAERPDLGGVEHDGDLPAGEVLPVHGSRSRQLAEDSIPLWPK
jgi:hypothetical protein